MAIPAVLVAQGSGTGSPTATVKRISPADSVRTDTARTGTAQVDTVRADTVRADTAQGRPLSLADAVRFAEGRNETVGMARNAVRRAQGQQRQARSALFPQLNASANYTRTLRSQYQGVFGGGSPSDTVQGPPAPAGPCDQYLLDASATTVDRVAGLEAYAQCASAGNNGGLNFSNLPFGQANAYTIGLNATQNLFTGGRISGQVQATNAGRESAEIELTAQQAQLVLDVTEAYYDAALSDRLLAIAQSALAQSERLLHQTQLQYQVGNAAEFDLLRATVARDNQRPIVIQRQSDRQVAYLRLKQLLNLPLDAPVHLTTSIEDSTALPPGISRARIEHPDTASTHRATVREAYQNILAQQGLLKVARSQRFPSLQLSSQFGGVAYPTGGLPNANDFRANWTVTLATAFPIFTGGLIRGDEDVAKANLRDAQDQFSQAQKYAALDTRVALNDLRQAEAALAASQGTAEQAQRAYQIAEVRYNQGISTQLELTDAQNLLEQALANRASAARNVLVARVKLALLPDLPVQAPGTSQSAAATQQQTSSQAQQRQTQGQFPSQTSSPSSPNPAATGTPGSGF
jgi:outer membrane protein TolC